MQIPHTHIRHTLTGTHTWMHTCIHIWDKDTHTHTDNTLSAALCSLQILSINSDYAFICLPSLTASLSAPLFFTSLYYSLPALLPLCTPLSACLLYFSRCPFESYLSLDLLSICIWFYIYDILFRFVFVFRLYWPSTHTPRPRPLPTSPSPLPFALPFCGLPKRFTWLFWFSLFEAFYMRNSFEMQSHLHTHTRTHTHTLVHTHTLSNTQLSYANCVRPFGLRLRMSCVHSPCPFCTWNSLAFCQ